MNRVKVDNAEVVLSNANGLVSRGFHWDSVEGISICLMYQK